MKACNICNIKQCIGGATLECDKLGPKSGQQLEKWLISDLIPKKYEKSKLKGNTLNPDPVKLQTNPLTSHF